MSDSVRPHGLQPTRLPRPWDSPGKNTGVGCHCLLQCMKGKSESEVAQSCPTLRDPMVCSLPGSSVHGIFQARVLEWGAIAFSDDQPRQHIKKQRHYFANKVGSVDFDKCMACVHRYSIKQNSFPALRFSCAVPVHPSLLITGDH